MDKTLKIGLTTLLIVVALLVTAFFIGRYSKQCPQTDPIIRYVQTQHQINTIQNEIDSIDLLISIPNVTLSRSKRDSLRNLYNKP
jgi:type IV pilus biogenesis protein CpaD/CtpE